MLASVDTERMQRDGYEAVVEEERSAADTWLNAIRGVRDNPIATYWPLMARRRAERSRRGWRRYARLGWGLSGLAVACFMIWPLLRDSGLPVTEQWLLMSLALVVPLFAMWNYVGQLFVFREALGALNRVPGVRQAERIDEMMCISRLSDREMVVGLLRVLLPPLLIRVVAAALLLQTGVMMLAYEASAVPDMQQPHAGARHADDFADELAKRMEFWHESRNQVIAWSPVLIGGLVVGGALAAVVSTLWLLMLGRRRLSLATIGVEAYLLAGLQALGSLFYIFLLIGQFAGRAFYDPGEYPFGGSLLVGFSLFMVIIAGLAAGAWRWQPLRNAVPLGLPLVMAGSGVLLIKRIINAGPDSIASSAAYFLHTGYSAFCVANPLTVPYTGCLGNWVYYSVEASGAMKHVWRIEVLMIIALQLAMIAALAWLARRSVLRFRQGTG